MKRISFKAITVFAVVFIVALLSIFIGKVIVRNNRINNELTAIAKSYGLKNIKIIINGKISEYDLYDVTVESSNFDSLSYSQMYSLGDDMSFVDGVYVSKYTSDGDTYEVFAYTKSIYKNGSEINSNYWNSESYRDATKNDDNKSDYSPPSTKSSSYSFTPYKSPIKNNDDPYNAKDYSNEEDFYDDHYEDFFDYYDAEDYYREHKD